MTAEKDLMPNIPKLEIVNVPPWNEKNTCNFLCKNTFMTALLAFNLSIFNLYCLVLNNCVTCTVH